MIEMKGVIRFKQDGTVNFTGSCPDGADRLATPLQDALQASLQNYREVGMEFANITIQIEPR